jgi:hypothetical protein
MLKIRQRKTPLLRCSGRPGTSQQANYLMLWGIDTKRPLPAAAELKFCFHDVFSGFYIYTGLQEKVTLLGDWLSNCYVVATGIKCPAIDK